MLRAGEYCYFLIGGPNEERLLGQICKQNKVLKTVSHLVAIFCIRFKHLFLLPTAYALAGRVDIDFETEPLGHDTENKPVFLRDIWPTRQEIQVKF